MTDEKVQELWQEYRKAKAEYEQAHKSVGNNWQKAFALSVKDLFADNPDLVSFGWTQYIPSFNDGEPCTFRTRAYDPFVNDMDAWGDLYGDADNPVELTDAEKKRHKELCKLVGRRMEQFNKGELEEAFGSNASVRVTRDSIEVSDYDCGY